MSKYPLMEPVVDFVFKQWGILQRRRGRCQWPFENPPFWP